MYRIQKNQNDEDKFETNFIVDQLKQQLINYIYNIIDLSRFKYELLQYESELPQLIEKKYFISANFSGSNCLLIFAKIKDKYHSFLVDRKTLSYNSQKVNLKTVKIINVHLKLDLDIYQGTIFDGIYIQGKTQKTFVITDVYVFKGQELIESHLDAKLLTIITYLKSNYNENDKDNDIIIAINRLYNLDETEHVVNNVIPKIKDFSARGICFYPEKSGTKLIYLFGNETRKENGESNIILQNNNSNKKNILNNYSKDDSSPENKTIIPIASIIKKNIKTIYIPKSNISDKKYIFEMKNTNIVDVYILNVVEYIIKGEKTHLKRIKIGLAFIPNVAKSKWCKEIMENTDSNILVHCKFHEDKNKWEPISVSTSKRPSAITDFDVKYIDD